MKNKFLLILTILSIFVLIGCTSLPMVKSGDETLLVIPIVDNFEHQKDLFLTYYVIINDAETGEPVSHVPLSVGRGYKLVNNLKSGEYYISKRYSKRHQSTEIEVEQEFTKNFCRFKLENGKLTVLPVYFKVNQDKNDLGMYLTYGRDSDKKDAVLNFLAADYPEEFSTWSIAKSYYDVKKPVSEDDTLLVIPFKIENPKKIPNEIGFLRFLIASEDNKEQIIDHIDLHPGEPSIALLYGLKPGKYQIIKGELHGYRSGLLNSYDVIFPFYLRPGEISYTTKDFTCKFIDNDNFEWNFKNTFRDVQDECQAELIQNYPQEMSFWDMRSYGYVKVNEDVGYLELIRIESNEEKTDSGDIELTNENIKELLSGKWIQKNSEMGKESLISIFNDGENMDLLIQEIGKPTSAKGVIFLKNQYFLNTPEGNYIEAENSATKESIYFNLLNLNGEIVFEVVDSSSFIFNGYYTKITESEKEVEVE